MKAVRRYKCFTVSVMCFSPFLARPAVRGLRKYTEERRKEGKKAY